jgi:hypothetical protein
MKAIVSINTVLPTVPNVAKYLSGESLRDYDIAIFAPGFPYLDRINFSGGGSCLTIESTRTIVAAMKHWAGEIDGALKAGKTVFVLLDEHDEDSGASGYETKAKNRTYNTFNLNNYQALPAPIKVRNTKGKQLTLLDPSYRGLLDALKEVSSYKVILEEKSGDAILGTRDGAVVGSIARLVGMSGHLVLLPYFDLSEYGTNAGERWSAKATKVSQAIVAQLVAIDRALTTGARGTPPPDWLAEVAAPQAIRSVEADVKALDAKIADLGKKKERHLRERDRLLAFSRLLYENGKELEAAIEEALKVLGFAVENYRKGDLEIDHIIEGPSGIRMIGESEGKDTSAIDIAKFRQLESNINEDFEREEVVEPAKGVLFGNDHRLTRPQDRTQPFTDKCLTNAKRLGTALVRTADLYGAVVNALDRPDDETFREACRHAIETTRGEVVAFPSFTISKVDVGEARGRRP